MNLKMKKYLTILTLLLNTYCSREKNPIITTIESDFSIFLTKSMELQLDSDINKVELESVPLLTTTNISFYDFSTHCIYLTESRDKIYSDLVDENNTFKEIYHPFVLIAQNERIYMGWLWSPFKTSMGTFGPSIFDTDYFPEDVIQIFSIEPYNFLRYEMSDVRDDDRIKRALQEASIFHAGLNVELASVTIVTNADTSTVQYTFTITNNDKDNLYIPDPYLMADSTFHKYTSGVVFKTNNNTYWCKNKSWQINIFENWNPLWYKKIRTNESIKRTLTLRGYPKIPPGNYSCYFPYAAPTKIERDRRFKSDGRYWIGWVNSNILPITISD